MAGEQQLLISQDSQAWMARNSDGLSSGATFPTTPNNLHIPTPNYSQRGSNRSWRYVFLVVFSVLLTCYTIALLPPRFSLFPTSDSPSATDLKEMSKFIISSVEPIKSEEDDRQYRYITLSNNMSCLLISDATTDKAAAAMNVNVGHFSDPGHIPGLAHFLEHMLFLGTEKYPDDNSYAAFISQAGGHSNAYTAHEDTNFYFDVTSEHFNEALDRFAQFFLAPLFTADATDRELNAVENEHSKNILTDAWRHFQLLKSTSSPKSPFSKFGTGNRQTLKTTPMEDGIDVRAELIQFHRKHYSAHRMSLAVLSKDPLDALELRVASLFHAVSDGGDSAEKVELMPFEKSDLPAIYRLVPVKDIRTISIYWQMPSTERMYRQKPLAFLSHLIGHESEGSILSALKDKGWATRLSSGMTVVASGFSLFSVSVDVSVAGLSHSSEVVQSVLAYVSMLREADSDTLRRLWTEVHDVAAINFRFAGKQPPAHYCSSLSKHLRLYSGVDCVRAGSIYLEYDEGLIRRQLGYMTPDNLRIDMLSQSFDGHTDQVEKWYGSNYSVERPTADFLLALSSRSSVVNVSLPSPNEFISTDFSLHSASSDASPSPAAEPSVPLLMVEDETLRLWHKLDDVFFKPKLNVFALFTTAVASTSPRNSVLALLFVKLLEDSLTELSYDAELAGLDYSLQVQNVGLQLTFRGYNEKLPKLLELVSSRIADLQIDPDRFQLVHEQLLRHYRNLAMEQPYQHAVYNHALVSESSRWSRELCIKFLEEISVSDLEQFIPSLLQFGHWEVLCHGNILSGDAEALARSLLRHKLPQRALPLELVPSVRIAKLPSDIFPVYEADVTNPEEKNSCALVYFQIGENSVSSHALLLLLSQLASEPCFHELRTVQQLGYLVFSGSQVQSGVLGWRVIVQSTDHSARYLLDRILQFCASLRNKLSSMSSAEFESNLSSLIAKRLEKAKRLSVESGRHWSEIAQHRYSFRRREEEVKVLRGLDQRQLLAFYDSFIRLQSSHCRTFVTLLRPRSEQAAASDNPPTTPLTINGQSVKMVRDLAEFKRSLAFYPVLV